jgi:hypothetical protein
MEELGAATEHEMVFAFLQAEIGSVRFGHIYAEGFRQLGQTRALVDHANLGDDRANDARMRLLRGVRGYGANAYLFNGFPNDARWRRARLTQADFRLLRYANQSANGDVFALSHGTRRVLDAAANFPTMETAMSANVRAVAEAVRGGRQYPPLIAVDSGQGDFIMVEGYTRVTAYAVVGQPETVEFLIGTSPNIGRWVFY